MVDVSNHKARPSSIAQEFRSVVDGVITSRERLFYVGLLCLVLSNTVNRITLDASIKNPVVLILQLFTLAFYFAQFMLHKPKGITLLSTVAIGVLAALVGFVPRSYTLLWLVLTIVCADGAELKRVAFVVLCGYLFVFVLTLVLVLFGVIDNIVVVRGAGEGVRLSLGFNHPNQLGFFLVTMSCAYISVLFPNLTLWRLAPVLGAALVALFVADSRTSVIGMALLIVFCFAQSKVKSERQLRTTLISCAAVVVLCALGSIVLAAIYDDSNGVMFQISKLLSSRPYYSHYYFENYPITLFGNNFSEAERIVREGVDTTLLLDNAYCMLLLRHGIVGFCLLMTLSLCAFGRGASELSGMSWAMGMALFSILGLSENAFIDVSVNFYLVGLISALPGHTLGAFDPGREHSKME